MFEASCAPQSTAHLPCQLSTHTHTQAHTMQISHHTRAWQQKEPAGVTRLSWSLIPTYHSYLSWDPGLAARTKISRRGLVWSSCSKADTLPYRGAVLLHQPLGSQSQLNRLADIFKASFGHNLEMGFVDFILVHSASNPCHNPARSAQVLDT